MTIGILHEDRGTRSRSTQTQSAVHEALLACGFLASLIYLATDIVGGLFYQGYNFSSQAISELGATGAPSKGLVDPLFIIYGLVMLAFGLGVIREAGKKDRALRFTGVLATLYAAIGLPSMFFAMHQRGSGGMSSDLPHIVLTAVLVLLLLLVIGFGAFALGSRFRVYSFATLLTVVVFGALTAPYARRIAAGEPTPLLGIIERIDVYAALLWIAVLSISLVRRSTRSARSVTL